MQTTKNHQLNHLFPNTALSTQVAVFSAVAAQSTPVSTAEPIKNYSLALVSLGLKYR
jgi:hypothetical protein